MDVSGLADVFERVRPELQTYICRLLLRPALAEDVVQACYLKAQKALSGCPDEEGQIRAWLFRIATNLSIDERRRHGHWRETTLVDLRSAAESNPDFVALSRRQIASPESTAIAREHLAICFSCVLRNFPEQKAAALLLREVHGFSSAEIANWLDATPIQVKNWLQETRVAMEKKYAETCALITKQGVCYQCVELDQFFHSGQGDPLAGTSKNMDARLVILRDFRAKPPGPWHRTMFELLESP